MSSLTRQLMKERCDEWVQQLANEKNPKVSAAVLALLADWYGAGQRVGISTQGQLLDLTKKALKCEGHQVNRVVYFCKFLSLFRLWILFFNQSSDLRLF